jgi:hypothetical protein
MAFGISFKYRYAECHGAILTSPYISWWSPVKAKKLGQNNKNFVFLLVFFHRRKVSQFCAKTKKKLFTCYKN